MIEFDTYNYEHLVKKCHLVEEHRKTLFDFYDKLFVCCGDMDEFNEKNCQDKKTRSLADMVSELSDSMKLEVWRELERHGLDIIYEKERLNITRDKEGNIVS
tara:strand:+ start:1535 stop:1840 length:306 start_codon:yes stop_codon:yes gene_type:complete